MEKKIRPRVVSGKATQEPWRWERPHAELSRRAAEGGIVLLKNEGMLPLQKGSALAVYGAGATRTIKGGTGSGDVNERHSVTILEGLRAAGFRITTERWLEAFEREYTREKLKWRDAVLEETARRGGQYGFFFAYSTMPFQIPAGPLAEKTEADTAVWVLSRVAGEGKDRAAGPGDWLLSKDEEAQLASICACYDRVCVIVNAGGAVDLSFLDRHPQIKALLVVSQPGMEGGHAVARVLCGEVCPSGHLTDTWAYRYEDYPTAAHFSSNDGDPLHGRYEEGIFVGYRYFDTFDVPVRYGFGDGLSYTTFALSMKELTAAPDGTAELTVEARNTGAAAGRCVTQAYAELPLGRLPMERRRLVAYGKTEELAPGAACELRLRFGAEELCSYDEARSAYVLEPGRYGLWLGQSLNGSEPVGALELSHEIVLRRVEAICPTRQELKELRPDPEKAAAHRAELERGLAGLPCVAYDAPSMPDAIYEEPAPDPAAAAIVERLTRDQLVQLATGDPGRGQGSMLGAAGISVPGAAGETSVCAEAQGVPGLVLADGPAGLRLNREYRMKDGYVVPQPLQVSMENGFFSDGEAKEGEPRWQYCTAMPVGTLLAQSWDLALVEAVGAAVGEEMEAYGVTLWLAPGMNIHRDPLCGRNFEYYAEDPLVTGQMAAAMTRGVQSVKGCGTTIKHFACNSQEDERMRTDAIVSERALRQIYLRGFGIAIDTARPMSIMTSYNTVNGVHSANCYDLCTRFARCEHGFDGVIMTDWTTTNNGDPGCTAPGCIRAGNDLVMPGMPMDQEALRAALEDGSLTEACLRDRVSHLVSVALRSDRFTEA